jgi:hypothetical protein
MYLFQYRIVMVQPGITVRSGQVWQEQSSTIESGLLDKKQKYESVSSKDLIRYSQKQKSMKIQKSIIEKLLIQLPYGTIRLTGVCYPLRSVSVGAQSVRNLSAQSDECLGLFFIQFAWVAEAARRRYTSKRECNRYRTQLTGT